MENDGEFLRIIDASGEDYLYPAHYFEPFTPTQKRKDQQPVTIYLDEFTSGILHAEALAAHKSTSTLLREWIDERLDLPVATD